MRAAEVTQPGNYLYTDTLPGAEPVRVEVMLDDGELVACFPPGDGCDGAVIPVAEMSGTFRPR